MTDEKKTKHNVTVVYSGLDKEEADKLVEYLNINLKPDVVTALNRSASLLQFFYRFTLHTYTMTGYADFDETNEAFSSHPKNVMVDIQARAKFILDIFQKVLDGRSILVGDDMAEIMKLIEKDNEKDK